MDFEPAASAPAARQDGNVVWPFVQSGSVQGITSDVVRGICELRRKRGDAFPAKLFGDPTWDILLQLYAARLESQRLSITRLTKLCGLPATTVLRRLGVLEEEGLVTRAGDPFDGRRIYVTLSCARCDARVRCIAATGLGAAIG
jgi:DNA-binding transcriptional ArsR family regulator